MGRKQKGSDCARASLVTHIEVCMSDIGRKQTDRTDRTVLAHLLLLISKYACRISDMYIGISDAYRDIRYVYIETLHAYRRSDVCIEFLHVEVNTILRSIKVRTERLS